MDKLNESLAGLLVVHPQAHFSFLGNEVVFGQQPLRALQDWEWSTRLAGIGVQRLELDQATTPEDLETFIEDILTRLTMRGPDTSEIRQTRPSRIRFGQVGLKDEDRTGQSTDVPTATLDFTLGEEVQTLRWLQEEVASGRGLPLTEAEAVVRSLSVAMHGQQQIMLPLLQLREFDEYTTTHSMNVSVLTMGLAEWLGMTPTDVRAFGIAGLLHDLGKIRIPKEVLNKPGKLTQEERQIMNAHPVEGARIIIGSDQDLDMASVVAYEHHVMLNGGGYPTFRYPRNCHKASELVHVCDVYDALRTNRPYRDAWPRDKVVAYVEERSGTEFEGTVAHAFTEMIRTWEPHVARATDDHIP